MPILIATSLLAIVFAIVFFVHKRRQRFVTVRTGDLVRIVGRGGWWPVWAPLDRGRAMIEDVPGHPIGPCLVIEVLPQYRGHVRALRLSDIEDDE